MKTRSKEEKEKSGLSEREKGEKILVSLPLSVEKEEK